MNFFCIFCFMPSNMDLFAFLRRKNMSQAALAKALNTTPSNVNRWAKGEGVPSYEICRELLLLGMTVKELFGIEYHEEEKVFKIESSIDEVFNSPRFKEKMNEAIEDLRRRGLIK